MRRFLAVWGPSLIGSAITTAGAMGFVVCFMHNYFVSMVPCVFVTGIAGLATIFDTEDGPRNRRQAIDPEPCPKCRHLSAVEKDRDELRAALVALDIPRDP